MYMQILGLWGKSKWLKKYIPVPDQRLKAKAEFAKAGIQHAVAMATSTLPTVPVRTQ